jgi:hypothetical protein
MVPMCKLMPVGVINFRLLTDSGGIWGDIFCELPKMKHLSVGAPVTILQNGSIKTLKGRS